MNPERWMLAIAVGIGDGARIQVMPRLTHTFNRQCHATYAFAKSLDVPGEGASFWQVFHFYLLIFLSGERQRHSKLKMLIASAERQGHQHSIPTIHFARVRLGWLQPVDMRETLAGLFQVCDRDRRTERLCCAQRMLRGR